MNETEKGLLYDVTPEFIEKLNKVGIAHRLQIMYTIKKYLDSLFGTDFLCQTVKLAGATRPLKRTNTPIIFYMVEIKDNNKTKYVDFTLIDLEYIDVNTYLDMYINNKILK